MDVAVSAKLAIPMIPSTVRFLLSVSVSNPPLLPPLTSHTYESVPTLLKMRLSFLPSCMKETNHVSGYFHFYQTMN